MGLNQMQEYLQTNRGEPVVLRKEGTTGVRCVYCQELHDHDGPPGYHVAPCDEKHQSRGILIGGRTYSPAWGYFIYDFKKSNKGFELLVPVEELIPAEEPEE